MATKGDDSSTTSGVPFPGFRFPPTDEELVAYYLKRKVSGKLGAVDAIPEIDIYRYEPSELPSLSKLKTPDLCWHFFSRINDTASRTNRATQAGYWKSTGKDRCVHHNSRVVGMKKTLVYYRGRAPKGERTDWVILEYKLTDERLETAGVQQDNFVLCKLFNKSGPGPKIGEQQYAALIPKVDYGSDDDNDLSADVKFPQDVRWKYPKDGIIVHRKIMCASVDLLGYEGKALDEQQASDSTILQIDINATGLENQDSDEKRLGKQTLEHESRIHGLQSFHFIHLELLRMESLFLFGEGYGIEKEKLIQLWLALELLTDEGIGADFIEKLASEGYILCSVANSLYKVNTEKLNTELDIVRERQSYAVLGNGSEIDNASTETLHVSVLFDEIDETIFMKLRRFKRLRTLLFLGNSGSRLQQVPRDLFMCYESLVALDLSGTHIKELPSSTRKMINLRYLDLSWTLIELLPERIDRFQGLQTLKLKGCSHLCRLPKEMKTLTELRHLDLDVLRQLTAFPKGIGALVNLRTLSAFPVGIEEGLKISELKHLNNLTSEFCIANLQNLQSAEEAKEASMIAKRSIKKLELRWSRHHQSQGPKNEDEAILENLRPYSDLEEIQILCYHGTSLPSWISDVSLHKLVSISLMKCENVSILPSLEKLLSLKSLELVGLSSVMEMNCGGHVAFPKLQKLSIDGLLNLETWTEAQEGDYPSLSELSIKDCPKLPELPSLFYLPSLKLLEVSGCSKLAFLSEKQLSSSLQQLTVEECPLIEERCSKQKGQDWYKIQHVPTIWIDQVAIQREYEDDEEVATEEDDESDW